MKLIDDWRSWWRMWSVRISALATAVWAYLLVNPDMLEQVLSAIPPEWRDVLPPAAPVVVFMLVTFARLAKQEARDGRK